MEKSSSSSSLKKGLSSNVLNMKFMKRREEGERREKARKEEEKRLLEARWVVKSTADETVILMVTEDRFDLSPPIGRRSFKGYNPSVETLVQQQLREHKQLQERMQKRKAALDSEQKQDPKSDISSTVSDKAMVKALLGDTSTMGSKRRR